MMLFKDSVESFGRDHLWLWSFLDHICYIWCCFYKGFAIWFDVISRCNSVDFRTITSTLPLTSRRRKTKRKEADPNTMGLQFAMRCCIFVWALYVFFSVDAKRKRMKWAWLFFLLACLETFGRPKKNLVMSLSFCRNTLSRFKIVIHRTYYFYMFGNVCAFAIACPSPGVVPLHLQPTRHHWSTFAWSNGGT